MQYLRQLSKANLEGILKRIGVYSGSKLSKDLLVAAKKKELRLSQQKLSERCYSPPQKKVSIIDSSSPQSIDKEDFDSLSMKFEEEDEEEVQCQEVFTAKTEFATPIKMHQHKKSSFVEPKATKPMVEESKSKL